VILQAHPEWRPPSKKSFHASNFFPRSLFISFIHLDRCFETHLASLASVQCGESWWSNCCTSYIFCQGGLDDTQLAALSKGLPRFWIPFIVVDPAPLTAIIAFPNCPRWILYPSPPASLG
jgi:hypothetical protein